MSKDNLLSIDCGTQSVRALVFDPRGTLLVKEQVYIEPYFSENPGWAEQHVEVYWQALNDATSALFRTHPHLKESIRALSVTTQRSTIINLDKEGKPLRPAMVWLDQRRAEKIPPLKGFWKPIFKISRLATTVDYLRAEAEANWFKYYQPEVWEKTEKYIFLSGYLLYRLTGEFVDSVGSQVGYIPFDYKRQSWAGKWDWKWQGLPVQKKHLPRLVKQGEVLGEISAEAAKALSLPEKLPVIASAADKACEVIGAGTLDSHIGCLSYGTTATINAISEDYVEAIPLIPPFPSAVPDLYNIEIQIYRGFWMVSWFKEQFAGKEIGRAKKLGVLVEDLFDEMVASVSPGSDGLVLQPYWSPGLRHPGPEARGAVIGFGDVHTRAHLYRAILEGIAYALKEGAGRIAKKTGEPFRELRVAGGGSQSNAAMQLTADIFNLPAIRPHVYEASGLGAAINAAVGSGIHPDYKTAIKEMTHKGRVFDPNPKTREIYQLLYEEVYLKMYGKLQPLYKSIRKIVNSKE